MSLKNILKNAKKVAQINANTKKDGSSDRPKKDADVDVPQTCTILDEWGDKANDIFRARFRRLIEERKLQRTVQGISNTQRNLLNNSIMFLQKTSQEGLKSDVLSAYEWAVNYGKDHKHVSPTDKWMKDQHAKGTSTLNLKAYSALYHAEKKIDYQENMIDKFIYTPLRSDLHLSLIIAEKKIMRNNILGPLW